MKRIPLTQDKFALCDDEDYDALTRYSWFAVECSGHWYAARKARVDGRQVVVYMHRHIMGASALPVIDHIDRNGLNNTRTNLRFATRAQNMANTARRKRSSTGYRGVVWCARLGQYRAQIGVNDRKLMLGTHRSARAAAHAYDEAAKELFGDFAVLNFPER